MFAHFYLDAVRLDSIINDGLDDAQRVDQHDIQLLAMSGMHSTYSSFSVRLIGRAGDARATDTRADGRPIDGHAAEAWPAARLALEREDDRPARPVRNYLYSKYGYGTAEDFAALSAAPAHKRSGR
jgi:hypothetical protein